MSVTEWQELREKADRLRALAASSGDAQIAALLRRIAEEFDREAVRAQLDLHFPGMQWQPPPTVQ